MSTKRNIAGIIVIAGYIDSVPNISNIVKIIRMMVFLKKGLVYGLLAALLSVCALQVFSTQFISPSRNHSLITVIPFHIYYTGKKPAQFNHKQMDQDRQVQTNALQLLLHNRISKQSNFITRDSGVRLFNNSQIITGLYLDRVCSGQSLLISAAYLTGFPCYDVNVTSCTEKNDLWIALTLFSIKIGKDILDTILEDIPVIADKFYMPGTST